ncbi:hypothetical protein H0H92_008862 [Tricholoma furcatifolium]|nr:hypothetical protein H0H92_008862 [Tricholoma furcatifolium]
MPRTKEWTWDHFYQDKEKRNSTHYGARCKFCTNAHLSEIRDAEVRSCESGLIEAVRSDSILLFEAKKQTPCTTGKALVMLNHLISCQYCPSTIKDHARKDKNSRSGKADDVTVGDTDDDVPTGVEKRSSRSLSASDVVKKQRSFVIEAKKSFTFGPQQQIAFEDQLLRAFVSAGWAYNSITDPEVMKLFRDYVPSARLPDRNKFSGPILKRTVVKIEGELKEIARDEFSTMVNDGWKDISRKHLIGFMFTAKEFTFN